jgi:preprotein translocase subunit SecA
MLAIWIGSAIHARDDLQLGRDYIKTTNRVTDTECIKIVDSKITGRVSHSNQWSHRIFKFMEATECVPVHNQNTTIASICHSRFFDRYALLFSLTGTVGEKVKRDEIMYLYGVDAFDVPLNRPCQRVCEPTCIFPTVATHDEVIFASIIMHQASGGPYSRCLGRSMRVSRSLARYK